jgi:membrane protein DedA with SNARE-associated domain
MRLIAAVLGALLWRVLLAVLGLLLQNSVWLWQKKAMKYILSVTNNLHV